LTTEALAKVVAEAEQLTHIVRVSGLPVWLLFIW